MYATGRNTRRDTLATLGAVVLVLAALPALYLAVTGDFPGSTLFYGQEEDSRAVDMLLSFHGSIVATFAMIFHAAGNAVTILFV